jgi:hypothetical protein
MSNGHRICWRFFSIVAAAMLTPIPVLAGDEAKTDTLFRQYYVNATAFSVKPSEEITTYRGYGSGGAGPNGTFGSGIADHGRRFEVEITGKLRSHRFLVVIKVAPEKEDTRTRSQEKEYDLTDLQPKSVELARDDDGRVYRLNLSPLISESPPPKQFKVADLNLQAWTFPPSPVIVNDQDYVGELNAGSGPIARFEVPGLASVEFSLLRLKNALPLGTLQDGVININHPSGTTVRISNVKNGSNREVLSGGPYQVWVRWQKPRESIEEYRKSLKATIADMKERAKKDELSLPPGSLERLEKISESRRANIMEFEIRAAEPSDLAEPADMP